MSNVAFAWQHALALGEGGLVYAWGKDDDGILLGSPYVRFELLPKPVEALRSVRVGSIAAASGRSYAVASTGELWVWGADGSGVTLAPLGHGEETTCRLPTLIEVEAPWDIKVVDAVIAKCDHTFALVDDGSVYAWGNKDAASKGVLGLGITMCMALYSVRKPQCVPELRLSCGL
jgi:alpha-tubulin suppressor-like RCC1 family protein